MGENLAVDPEIEAIRAILQAVEPLDGVSRRRVVKYLLDRLDLSPSEDVPAPSPDDEGVDEALASSDATHSTKADSKQVFDVRSLVAEKRPKSAIEMATLVAYYLAELSAEPKKSVNAKDLERYFKQGAYPLPKVLRFTLTNAKEYGYLELAARGEYRLTPVGHNLVAHEMPSSGSATSSKRQPAQTPRRPKKGKRKLK